MKTKLLFVLIAALLLVSSAFAVSVSDVSYAENRPFQRSNPIPEGSKSLIDHRDEAKYITYNIRVTADDEDLNVTSLSPVSPYSYDGFGGPISQNMTFEVLTTLPRTITANQSADIQVRVMVPSDLNSIDANYNTIRHEYPVNVFTTDGSAVSTLAFYVINGLELDNVELVSDSESFYCDVDLGRTSLDCDREIEELAIRDFTLKFDIENMFDYRDDLDFDKVRITIDSDNRDVKPSKRSYDENIDAEEVVSFSVLFSVNDRIKDGDRATITLRADVTDDNDAKHGFEYTFDVRFRVPDYDVDVKTISLSQQVICQAQSSNLLYTIENLGRRSQSNIRVQILNSELGLDKVSERITLDAVDSRRNVEYSGQMTIGTTATTSPKVYPISVRVYHRDKDGDNAFILRTVTLVVERCDASGNPITSTTPTTPSTGGNGQTQTNTTTTQPPIIVVQPTEVTPTTGGQTGSGSTTGFNQIGATITKNNDAALIIGLVVVAVILLILIGILLVVLARK
jgi:hypothetical protein